MAYANDREIRIFAMQRSGHNAIMSWIAGNCPGNVIALSKPKTDRNIFVSFDYRSFRIPNNGLEKIDIPAEASGKFSSKDFLIYDIENMDLSSFSGERIEAEHDAVAGSSRGRYDVVILRDPFNLFASMIMFYTIGMVRIRGDAQAAMSGKVRIWKQYAREFAGDTGFLANNKVAIGYNQWLSSKEYRGTIASTLRINNDDSFMERITLFGGGSSFGKICLRDSATKMRTLERWKVFQNNGFYISLFDDEVFELSKRVFGEIPGTEVLRSKRYAQKGSLTASVRKQYEASGIFFANRTSMKLNSISKILRKKYAHFLAKFAGAFPGLYLRVKNMKHRITE